MDDIRSGDGHGNDRVVGKSHNENELSKKVVIKTPKGVLNHFLYCADVSDIPFVSSIPTRAMQ